MYYNKSLGKPLFILAPMDDVTDTAFRQIISRCASPDLCFSEFVNVDGLASTGREKLLDKLSRDPSEPPLIAHIWGLNPNNFSLIADQVSSGFLRTELGEDTEYAGIDLNMGCPVRTVIKNGACSALISNRPLAAKIIAAVKLGAAGRLPISVKTRLGYNTIDSDWTKFLLSQGLDMLTIHLRTVKEMSKVPAHYEELDRIKKERDMLSPNTLLIANGDIEDYQQGLNLVEQFGIDGVMIGRGIFKDPYVFKPNSPWEQLDSDHKIDLFRQHIELYLKTEKEPNRGLRRLNKYARIYINGFDGAKEIRERLTEANSIEQMLATLC